ncbi:hypothetical protein HD600_001048 [Microbacterium ginsengiterrae]|uniref:DNA-binding MarR family transcriptional regulator n=1 Tax=Microbacterium ginsengiterrae TaxID=546115 RepID=A0A7W9CBU3_9MICO|nr:hypothetical protein [Microbacterium ginsengiterrae]MBB5742551.1 hypothetical protein [Microbacterium ginsengiterrae]
MNTTHDTHDSTRPFGFWLKAVDRLMAAEFAAAFESFGLTRRDWRLLNRIDETVAADGPRPLSPHKLRRLLDIGWVTDTDGTWTLTDEGRDGKERLAAVVDGIRAKVTDAVPAEDLATTMSTLEQLTRAFGWEEGTPLPRGRGRGHGRPHGARRHGFGPRSFGHHPHAHGSDQAHCAHPEQAFGPRGHVHAHHGRARFAQGAYERGFDAGFSRGRAEN